MPFQEHRRVWERPDAGWGSRRTPVDVEQPWRPLVTWWFLGIIGAVFVLQLIVDQYDRSHDTLIEWTSRFGDTAWRDYSPFLFAIAGDWPWRPWTLLTSTFSHGSLMHLLFNGLFLYSFGPSVERLVGRKRYVALFLAGGALSGIVQAHLSSYVETGGATIWSPAALALGASGALMMVFGILLVLTPKARIFLLLFPVPMWVAAIFFVAWDLLGAANPASPIGNFAHLSGMALGLAYGMWTKESLRRRGLRVAYE